MIPRTIGLKVLPRVQSVQAVTGAVGVLPTLIFPIGHSMHTPALVVLLNNPGAHSAQTRSLVVVSATIAYEPGGQVVYGVQTLSAIAVPGVARNWEVLHDV